MTNEQPESFEAALAELETIVGQLESGELALAEMLTFYERGQELASWCQQQLDAAELTLEQLSTGSNTGDGSDIL